MSEKELSRKERLVLSIKARIGQLVYAVQDDEAHLRFEPGCSWRVSTLGASARKQYPDGVHFCDQIGVSQEDFEFALGKRWLSTEFPFSALKSRKVRCLNFVTVDLINPFSDYGSGVESPAAKSSLIVSRVASSSVSSSWAIPVSRLLRSIEGHGKNRGGKDHQHL
jgi:hypothetical protein